MTWDQHEGEDERRTDVVPCDRPHLFEVVERIIVLDRWGRFPSAEGGWTTYSDEICGPKLAAYLGTPVDPSGLFHASIIHPSPEGWLAGDRDGWCGVVQAPVTVEDFARPPTQNVTFVGKVQGRPQHRAFPVGSCFAETFARVDCASPHSWEVTGEVDLSDRVEPPPAVGDRTAWQALVGDACRSRLTAYLGRPPRSGEVAGWQYLSAESWAAGARIVRCTASQDAPDGSQVTLTASMREQVTA